MFKKRLVSLLCSSLPLFYVCTSSETMKSPSASAVPALPEKVKMASLTWKPNLPADEINLEPLSMYTPITVTLSQFEDIRTDPRIIGKTLEDKKIQDVYIPVATKMNVTKWCRNGIISSLRDLKIATVPKKGMLLVELELTECEINDNITQTGTIGFSVSAYSEDELLIWEGKISGKSDLYYRPKNSDGISECLSNTLKVTINNLFTEQSFRDAVIKAFELR